MGCQNRWPCCCSKSVFCTGCDENSDSGEYEYAILCRFRTQSSKVLTPIVDEQSIYYSVRYSYNPSFEFDDAHKLLSFKLNDVELEVPELKYVNGKFMSDSVPDIYINSYTGRSDHCSWALYYTDDKIINSFESLSNCECFRSFARDTTRDSYQYFVYMAGLSDIPYDYIPSEDEYYNSYFSLYFSYNFGGLSVFDFTFGNPVLKNPKLSRYKISKDIFRGDNNELDIRFSSLPFDLEKMKFVGSNNINYYQWGFSPYSYYYENEIKEAKVDVDYIVVRFRGVFPECIPNKSTMSALVCNHALHNLQQNRSWYDYKMNNYRHSFGFFYSLEFGLRNPNIIRGDYRQSGYDLGNVGNYNYYATPLMEIVPLATIDQYYGKGGRSFFDTCRREENWNPPCVSSNETLYLTANTDCIERSSITMTKTSLDQAILNSNYFLVNHQYYGQKTTRVGETDYDFAAYINVVDSYKRTNYFGSVFPQSDCWTNPGYYAGAYAVFQTEKSDINFFLKYKDVGPAPSGRLYTYSSPYSSGEVKLGSYYRYEYNGQTIIPDFYQNYYNINDDFTHYNDLLGKPFIPYYWYNYNNNYLNQSVTLAIEDGVFIFRDKGSNIPYYEWPSSGTPSLTKDNGLSCSPVVLDTTSALTSQYERLFIMNRTDRIVPGTGVVYQGYITVSGGPYVLANVFEDSIFGSPHYWSLYGNICSESGYRSTYDQVTVTS
jgi:hypothetical protein